MSPADARVAGAESPRRTLAVALVVCVACSVVVATAAVVLEPLQERNRALERKRNVLAAAGLLDTPGSIDERFARVESRVADLETGRLLDPGSTPPDAAPEPIPPRLDLGGIGERPRYVTVYLVRDGDRLRRVVLPVHGKGLWSTIRGFVALEGDLDTVAAITFHEHAETPGLGAEIDDPEWRGRWRGKRVRDAAGDAAIEVVKGRVDPDRPGAEHRVDGISGATLTGRGVGRLVRYWLGDDAYGPLLARLREETTRARP